SRGLRVQLRGLGLQLQGDLLAAHWLTITRRWLLGGFLTPPRSVHEARISFSLQTGRTFGAMLLSLLPNRLRLGSPRVQHPADGRDAFDRSAVADALAHVRR